MTHTAVLETGKRPLGYSGCVLHEGKLSLLIIWLFAELSGTCWQLVIHVCYQQNLSLSNVTLPLQICSREGAAGLIEVTWHQWLVLLMQLSVIENNCLLFEYLLSLRVTVYPRQRRGHTNINKYLTWQDTTVQKKIIFFSIFFSCFLKVNTCVFVAKNHNIDHLWL